MIDTVYKTISVGNVLDNAGVVEDAAADAVENVLENAEAAQDAANAAKEALSGIKIGW